MTEHVDARGRTCDDQQFIDEVLSRLRWFSWCATGSRVISPNPSATSDRDYIVLVGSRPDCEKILRQRGFVRGGYTSSDGTLTTSHFSAWRKFRETDPNDKSDTLNVVVTADKKFYDAYVLATSVSVDLGEILVAKNDRIRIFEAIVYGK
jgi:hypothetical protein